MVKIMPAQDRVLIEPLYEELSSSIGFIMPEQRDKRPERGTILAVGKGSEKKPMTVSVGQIVIFKKYALEEFEFDGKKLFIIGQDDILGTVE